MGRTFEHATHLAVEEHAEAHDVGGARVLAQLRRGAHVAHHELRALLDHVLGHLEVPLADRVRERRAAPPVLGAQDRRLALLGSVVDEEANGGAEALARGEVERLRWWFVG